MSTTIKQAIDGFLLNCKVEGKSWGTIDWHADKLKGFHFSGTIPARTFLIRHAIINHSPSG